jgi:1-acyl-sn-glycerol-3-phosphate acyltransferase/DNA-directed RNA polymerase subunit RPC12/RpoP
MRDLHKEFVYRKIKRPNRFLAGIVQRAFRLMSKQQNVEFVYDEDYLAMEDQQMIVFSQHRSRMDYIYVFAGLKHTNFNMLCGYQNIFQPVIYTLFKHLGVIAKMLYQPDSHATLQMMRCAKDGRTLVIFPEGIQSTSGSTHPINPATMKLLFKLKLPVALVTLKGAYFTRPRYTSDTKKGKITAHYTKLFAPEDFENCSSQELYDRLLEAFRYNEFTEHAENPVPFRGKKPNIDGLDNIIYKCPQCSREHRLVIEGDTMRCTECGFAIRMDEYYRISSVSGELPFRDIDQWYQWQRKQVAQEILQEDFSLTAPVKIGRVDTKRLNSNYSLEYYGQGTLTLTKEGLTYRGTCDGEEREIVMHPKQVYSLSISLAYELDLYYDCKYYNFKLLDNQKHMTKWMLAAEEIHNLHDPVWQKASKEVYDEGQ